MQIVISTSSIYVF